MKQAIEEGFILDVLANYTTYKSYYEIQKSIEDNPLFDTIKAQKKLRAYVERSQQTINTKAEIMLEHFIEQVVNTKKLRGKAKGMVVTQNIETAIRYYKAVQAELRAARQPVQGLIAFSGEKEVDGIKYTEAEMNGFPETRRFYFDGRRKAADDSIKRRRTYPAAGRREQVSDGFRSAEALRDVCRQEAAGRPGRAGAVAPEPFRAEAGQTHGRPLRARFLQHDRGHQDSLRSVLTPSRRCLRRPM